MQVLLVAPRLGLRVHNGGLFVSPGQGVHPDRILDSYELIFVRKGMLSLWEQDRRFDVHAGESLLLWPGRRHYGATPYPRGLSFYWLHFQVADRAKAPEIKVPQHARVARVERLTGLFHRFLDDQESQCLDSMDAALLLLQMLREVARAPNGNAARETVLVGRTEAYISSHLTEPLSTGRIARALRVNPDYLNRAFHRARRMTLTEHIHRRRLHDAEALLREGTGTVLEIANACGFTSVGHFRRLFERHNGLTPTAYRKLHARLHVNIR